MIWEGIYSEAAHFIFASLVAWGVLPLILDTHLTYLPKDRLVGVLGIILAFGFGSLLHFWLDSWQPYI